MSATGLQLPFWELDEDLYDVAGGGRQVDSLWVCGRLCTESSFGWSDGESSLFAELVRKCLTPDS